MRITGRWWELDALPEVALAVGMAGSQLGCPLQDAVTVLRGYAAAHRLSRLFAEAGIAALVEVVAAQAREGTNPRVWEHASRVARRVLEPHVEAPPAGPLPEGYASAGREAFTDPTPDPLPSPQGPS